MNVSTALHWLNAAPRSPLDREVLRHLVDRKAIAEHAPHGDTHLTFGERLADRVARFGGSWTFILIFAGFLLAWAAANSLLLRPPFDPYPYIFLNLMLSMLAAIQAPIIMMSQNRQAAKDRAQADSDYAVNLKAELEVMGLHEKIDALRVEHLGSWSRPSRNRSPCCASWWRAAADTPLSPGFDRLGAFPREVRRCPVVSSSAPP